MQIKIYNTIFYVINSCESPLALLNQIELDEDNLSFAKVEWDKSVSYHKQLTVLPHLQKYKRFFLSSLGSLPFPAALTTSAVQLFIEKFRHYPIKTTEELVELNNVYLLAMSFLYPINYPVQQV